VANMRPKSPIFQPGTLPYLKEPTTETFSALKITCVFVMLTNLVSLLPRYGAGHLESILQRVLRISRQVSLTTGALSADNENLHARSK
jgi:hypothetical protein